MKYKDREAMDLNTVGETQQAGKKISKKKLVTLLRLSYDVLDKNQVASIVAIIERMVVARQNGENLTVAFRDWNEDGTRRF